MPVSNPGGAQITVAGLTFTFPAAGTWTPVSGEVCLATVVVRRTSGTAESPTLTGTNGWNVTWTQIGTIIHGGSTLAKTTVYRGVPSSSTPGTLTVTVTASHAQCAIEIVSFPNIDQTTNQGVVQSVTNSGSTGGAMAATLAAFGSSSNYTFLGGSARGTPTGFTPEASYTPYSVLGGVAAVAAEWLSSSDTSPTGTFTGGTSVSWACVAVELKLGTGPTVVEGTGSSSVTFSSSTISGAIQGTSGSGVVLWTPNGAASFIASAPGSSIVAFSSSIISGFLAGGTGAAPLIFAATSVSAFISITIGNITFIFGLNGQGEDASGGAAGIVETTGSSTFTFSLSGTVCFIGASTSASLLTFASTVRVSFFNSSVSSSTLVFGMNGAGADIGTPVITTGRAVYIPTFRRRRR